MTDDVRLAVVGAGLIGQRHARLIQQEAGVSLCTVVDPAEAGRAFAEGQGVPWYPAIDQMLAAEKPDGVVIATPNQMHVEHGLAVIASGVPALVEKPIADSVAAAEILVTAAEAAGVPLLVGHHRRHNPLIQRAKLWLKRGNWGGLLQFMGFSGSSNQMIILIWSGARRQGQAPC